MELFKKKSVHNCIMSQCTVDYEAEGMIYTVTFQCKNCGKMHSVKMNSDCVHDFLVSVTAGF